MAKRNYLYVCLTLLLFSITLFSWGIHNFHDWGDDFAQYIKEGENIAEGKPFYQSGYIYNPLNHEYAPPFYPPGFPLVISPVIKIWGVNIKALLIFQSLIVVFTLVSLFFFFRRFTREFYAICLAIACVYSRTVIELKQAVLSDLLCLLCTTIYLTIRFSKKSSPGQRIVLILTGTLLLLIRSQMALLIVAEILYLIYTVLTKKQQEQKDKTQTSVVAIVVIPVLYTLLTKTLFASPQSGNTFYIQLFQPLLQNLWPLVGYNTNYLFDLLGHIFYHEAYDPFWQAFTAFFCSAGLIGIVLGFFISVREKLTVADIFFVLMCLLILLLPVYQGFRYLLPILPICMLYIFRFWKVTLSSFITSNKKLIAACILLLFLVLSYDDVDRASAFDRNWTPNTPDDTVAFRYIRQNIPDTSIIIFAKPRALNLFTGKKTIVLAAKQTIEENKRLMDKSGADFLLTRWLLEDEYYRDYLSKSNTKVDTVIINSKYTLYKIRR